MVDVKSDALIQEAIKLADEHSDIDSWLKTSGRISDAIRKAKETGKDCLISQDVVFDEIAERYSGLVRLFGWFDVEDDDDEIVEWVATQMTDIEDKLSDADVFITF